MGIGLFPTQSSSQIQIFAGIIKLPYANRAENQSSDILSNLIYRNRFLSRGVLTIECVTEHAIFSASNRIVKKNDFRNRNSQTRNCFFEWRLRVERNWSENFFWIKKVKTLLDNCEEVLKMWTKLRKIPTKIQLNERLTMSINSVGFNNISTIDIRFSSTLRYRIRMRPLKDFFGCKFSATLFGNPPDLQAMIICRTPVWMC